MSTRNWRRDAFLFLSGQAIALFGSALAQNAIIWHITLSTASGGMVAGSTLAGYLPQVAVSLFAGVWVDRYCRKRLIIGSDLAIAAVTALLLAAFLSGHGRLWMLFLALALRALGTGIQTPAINALIPQIVPPDQLMRFGGINSTLSAAIAFIAPAASAFLLSVASVQMALALNIATALLGVALTWLVAAPAPRRAEPAATAPWREIGAGLDYLREQRQIRNVLLLLFAVLFLASAFAFLTPLLVARSFGGEVWRLSASEMCFSAGAVVGGGLVAWWGGFRNRIHTMVLGCALYGLLMVGLGCVGGFPQFLALHGLIGLAMPLFNTPVTVLLQERVAPALQGRVFSLLQLSYSCALPLGMLLFGPLADRWAVQTILCLAGALVCLLAALPLLGGGFSPQPRWEERG
ncbi:MFS transporter [Chromobacterium subtsugae]|uniref:MFS transporter n=1 Tax=Chromobacterium subtsugae TaxID=251747 RepID=UPI00064166FB|nr:MFS transporter [Chromobacterium subtsugae]